MDTPCWVITLKPDSEPVVRLLQSLEEQNVAATLFPGVDGRTTMPAPEPGERLAPEITRWRHLCELTSSEVGGYLSHLRAIKKAHAEGLERVCILEDDVQLEADFGAVLRDIVRLPDEVEMVRLMALKVRKRKVISTFADGIHALVRPERGWCGGQGYVLNRRGMEKIIAHGSAVYEPIDKFYDHFWEYDLRLFGVEPHIIWETEHPSSILKSNVARARVAWWLYWLHPLGKGWRSLQRHAYLKRHEAEFYPAEKPQGKPGRTGRMKL